MSKITEILNRAEKMPPEREEIIRLLSVTDEEERQELYTAARNLKYSVTGKYVSLRGLVEFSNICCCDCLYCGVRKSNTGFRRYTMDIGEIVKCAEKAADFGYGSLVLQSGERSDADFVDFVEKVLLKIRYLQLGITLSCGVQNPETYQKWRDAGATRYLLRIESSSKKIFNQIHPPEISWESRLKALQNLRQADYQLGTGVMIGLPGQTVEDLADDIEFFRKIDADMIGMGPFLPQDCTPMGRMYPDFPGDAEKKLLQTLNMIAVTRLVLRDVNIASTTALQTIDPESGRERGLLAGANVIMPNVGDTEFRHDYQLYNGKPDLDENALEVREKLLASLLKIGEKPLFNAPGDSRHYQARKN